jgi:putative hemolysin
MHISPFLTKEYKKGYNEGGAAVTAAGNVFPKILTLLGLIAVNAFFAASEIAIISLNDQKVRRQAETGDKKSRLIYNLIREPSKFLATIQVGVTLSALMASAVASESFADQLTALLKRYNFGLDQSVSKVISVIVITVFLSYFSLVLGELVPKRLAMKNPESISRMVIHPLRTINKLTDPFIRFLSFSTNTVIRILGVNPATEEAKISEEEIRMMVDVGQERGVIPRTEKEMLDNVFKFDKTTVAEIMTHRTDVVAVPVDIDSSGLWETVLTEKHSRIPVYRETIDNVIGILRVKDLIPLLKSQTMDEIKIQTLLQEPFFVPASKRNNELLRELQKTKTHIAVVIDEYGGTSGIVTVEDLVEEIVGNIFDEQEEVLHDFEKIDEHTYLLHGGIALDDLNELLGLNLPITEHDTLNGFLLSKLGRIPKENERPQLNWNQVRFTVEKIEERRIVKVRAVKDGGENAQKRKTLHPS